MTQENKQLMVKELYARLPYHPMVNFNGNEGCDYKLTLNTLCNFPEDGLKLYLRPLNTITEKEKRALYKETGADLSPLLYNIRFEIDEDDGYDGYEYGAYQWLSAFDWFNTHHFDYRDLIGEGLALEAPEGMYKINV